MSAFDPKRTWLFRSPKLDYGPTWKICASYEELGSGCATQERQPNIAGGFDARHAFTRRDVEKLAGAATLAASSGTTAVAQTAQSSDMARPAPRQFPSGFFNR